MRHRVISAMLAIPQAGDLVGLWETTATSKGGIGAAFLFEANGTFTEAVAILVNGRWKVVGDRLFVGDRSAVDGADARNSAPFKIEGRVLTLAGPDGQTLRKERVGPEEGGQPAIVGTWRYAHPAGGTAYERYSSAGDMLFRLVPTSGRGRYEVVGKELVLSGSNRPNVRMTVVVSGDRLSITRG